MKRSALVLLILFLIISCSSQRNEIEINNLENNDTTTSEQENVQNEVEEAKPNYEELLGKVITMEGLDYRVINVDDSLLKVVSVCSVKTLSFGGGATSFGGTEGIQYSGSNPDTFLNEIWYNSLSDNMKEAIIEQNIDQSMMGHIWGFENKEPSGKYYTTSWIDGSNLEPYYILDNYGTVNVGNRYVYLLDVHDILNYLGDGFSPSELDNIFSDDDNNCSDWVWLRSSSKIASNLAYGYSSKYGCLTSMDRTITDGYGYGKTSAIYPAFVIDLSKIEYTIK